jgi:dihydrolipoamide dehydrogenase
MRTNVPGIYAIGDVVPTHWLAHVAMAEGVVAVEHMAGRETRPINYDQVPGCTYCAPEVASIGLSEAKARERGYDVRIGKFPFSANGKARIINDTSGFVKIVGEKKYDEVLGVHIVGPHATDCRGGRAAFTRGHVRRARANDPCPSDSSEAIHEAWRWSEGTPSTFSCQFQSSVFSWEWRYVRSDIRPGKLITDN